MTHEELLLKDLCARLPYGVIVNVKGFDYDYNDKLTQIYKGVGCSIQVTTNMPYGIEEVKPYLFPLSSMTEAQRIELYKVLGLGYESHYHLSKEWEDFNNSIDNNGLFLPASWVSDLNKMYNWLNKNNFDYQGLIPMELAIDATGLNIY